MVVAGSVGAVLAGAGVAVFGVREKVVEKPVVERVAVSPTVSALGAPGADTENVRSTATPTVVTVSTSVASGSGVVVRDDGIVVTSIALVPEGEVPHVRLPDGGEPDVEVVGVDAPTGLAVLDIAGSGYVPSVLADADDVVTGGAAIAMGRPGDDLTTGDATVGAAERYVGPAGTALDGIEMAGEADAGGLGGPVVDGRGAVLGITTAVDPGVAWYVAPVGVAHRVTRDLLESGVVRHCWLGIEGTDATSTDATSTPSGDEAESTPSGDEAETGTGTLVASVVAGSPAADGGLRVGDRVVRLGDDDIADMAALLVALRTHAPGDRVDVAVVRADGTRVTLVLRLESAPSPST